MNSAAQEEARRETIAELSALLSVVQRMGHRLACESHGEAYDLAQALNMIFRQANTQLEQIKLSIETRTSPRPK